MGNVIKYSAKSIYGQMCFKPKCEKSEALFALMNRYISTSELPLLGKMGFKLELFGDIKETEAEIKALEKKGGMK